MENKHKYCATNIHPFVDVFFSAEHLLNERKCNHVSKHAFSHHIFAHEGLNLTLPCAEL